MALPTTVGAGIGLSNRNYYCGPWLAPNGAVYVLKINNINGTTIEVFKATDPTSSFSLADSTSVTLNNFNTGGSIWSYLDGSTIHIASACLNNTDSNGDVFYHAFSTSTDAFTVESETIEADIKGYTTSSASCSIAIRSDGDRIVLYGGDPDTDMGTDFDRVDYARWEGTSWTAGIDVGGTSPANQNRRGASVVRGSGDNMHFFWQNEATPTLHGRTLDPSTNGLSSGVSVSTPAGATVHLNNGISYNDSGTQRITQIAPTTSGSVWRLTEDGSGDLSAVGLTDFTTLSIDDQNATLVASCALDGTTMYILFGNGADEDLYRGSAAAPQTSWGTDIEFLDAVTINRISVNIYDHSGTKLAMVYDNGGTVQYNEISLAVAPKLVGRLLLLGVGR